MGHVQAEQRRVAIPIRGKNGRLPGSEYDRYTDGRCLAHPLLTLIMTMDIINILEVRQVLFPIFPILQLGKLRHLETKPGPHRAPEAEPGPGLTSYLPRTLGRRQKCPGMGKVCQV